MNISNFRTSNSIVIHPMEGSDGEKDGRPGEKCCHRYLNCELLSAYNREGKYGSDFEGRTRFLLNVIDYPFI